MNREDLISAINIFKDKFDYLDIVSSNEDGIVYKRRTTAKSFFFGCFFNHDLTQDLVKIASDAMNQLTSLSNQIQALNSQNKEDENIEEYVEAFGCIITELVNHSMKLRFEYGHSYSITEGPGITVNGAPKYRQHTGWSTTTSYFDPKRPAQLEASLLSATKALSGFLEAKNQPSGENPRGKYTLSDKLNEFNKMIEKIIGFLTDSENYRTFCGNKPSSTPSIKI